MLIYKQINILLRAARMNLNDRQLEKLSDIFADIGLVALASVVIPAVFNRLDLQILSAGLIITFGCWAISLALRR